MGIIKPITLENCDWDSRAGIGCVDDFVAVVDGREDFPAALETAKELIQQQPFQAVDVIRESQTLDKSSYAIAGPFEVDNTFGLDETQILPWPQKNKMLYRQVRFLRAFGDPLQYKPIKNSKAHKLIGEDYVAAFNAARKVFPELLSWSIRRINSGHPGIAHFDEPNRPGLHNILELPQKYIQDAEQEHFTTLPGGITMTMALRHGGSIVCKTPTDQRLPENTNFYADDNTLTGYQAQSGDFLVLRARGWDKGFLPSCHLAPRLTRALQRRYVAVASSHTSFLAPQVRESLGRPRLPDEEDPVDLCLSEIDQIFTYMEPEAILEYFKSLDPEILQQVANSSTVRRFPEAVVDEIDATLEAA